MSMQDGLYKVQFQTPLGAGAGVVHLQGGKLWGGDSALYYVGTFTQVGDQFSAEVVTDRHTQYQGLVSVFGKDRVHINLRGASKENSAVATGTAIEAPGIAFKAMLSRLTD
jgi:hypothetical protein